jgi:predicted nuclease with RNAse H fold
MRVAGVHLAQAMEPTPRAHESAVVEVEGGDVHAPRIVESDDEILDALPAPPALVVVDAPLAIPNNTGKRDVEAVLAWCDIAAFPVSRRRIDALYGGARGVHLAGELVARGYEVAETIPDLVFRQLTWERDRPTGHASLDLREYRERWLSIRPPAPQAARELLGSALGLDAWPAGDMQPPDLAALKAVACAYAGWRHTTSSSSVDLGTPERGRMLIPADANLGARISLNAERLRSEGKILIPAPRSGW